MLMRSAPAGRVATDGGAAGASATTVAAGTAASTVRAATAPTPDALPAPSASELINEGLRQRQQVGAEAARPFFERAAQLEPNSHVPWFMLGNVASELGDLDTAVAHYAHARDLHPADHVIRYNLGLNQLWRGYIDAAIDELRVACGLNPTYLQAHSSHIMAMYNLDRIGPEEIDVAVREWGEAFLPGTSDIGAIHGASRHEPSGTLARGIHLRRLSDPLRGALL